MSNEQHHGEPEAVRSSGALDGTCENTDKEIWRKREGDYYSPSIHVTQSGGVGINVGGHVIVMPVEKWHALGRLRVALSDVFRVV